MSAPLAMATVAAVQVCHGLGQLRPNLILCGAVDDALDLFPGSRVPAHGETGLSVHPGVDGLCRHPGRLWCFFWALQFPPLSGMTGGQMVRQDFCPIAVPGVENAGAVFHFGGRFLYELRNSIYSASVCSPRFTKARHFLASSRKLSTSARASSIVLTLLYILPLSEARSRFNCFSYFMASLQLFHDSLGAVRIQYCSPDSAGSEPIPTPRTTL